MLCVLGSCWRGLMLAYAWLLEVTMRHSNVNNPQRCTAFGDEDTMLLQARHLQMRAVALQLQPAAVPSRSKEQRGRCPRQLA